MKKFAHSFSRDIIEKVLALCDLGSRELKSATYFELIAALMMHRLYEAQWGKPTMIGFFLTEKYAAELSKKGEPNTEDLLTAIIEGVEENNPIDFLLCTYDQEDGAQQEFQLKRFGLNDNNDTESLIAFLDGLAKKYARIDAACLVAVADISIIDWEKVNAAIDKDGFPFSELPLSAYTTISLLSSA